MIDRSRKTGWVGVFCVESRVELLILSLFFLRVAFAMGSWYWADSVWDFARVSLAGYALVIFLLFAFGAAERLWGSGNENICIW